MTRAPLTLSGLIELAFLSLAAAVVVFAFVEVTPLPGGF